MEVSVIIANYNMEKYLAGAIRSVLNQSFDKSEMELVVVDDASTDSSKKILKKFENTHSVRVIYNKENLGLVKSCNLGVEQVMGKHTIFIDADDFVNKNLLLVTHLYLTNNKDDMDACSCDWLEVDENENIIRRRSGDAYPIRCGVLYKTDDLIELGPYKEVPREDLEFRRRFLKSGRHIYNACVPLYRYRNHSESLTKNVK